MKVSVVIPCYNAARTIGATLNSVFRQTRPPDEILVLDDGSTDTTVDILNSHRLRTTVLQQENRGVASARNTLCERATGDLVAFLDHDDIWHPRYIEVQARAFEEHPDAVAFFAGHVDFQESVDSGWETDPSTACYSPEVIPGLEFFKRYNKRTGPFASLSYCCIPKNVLTLMGKEPFRVHGVDDSYCCGVLSTLGPLVYTSAPLAAYRVHSGSLSSNHLRTFGDWVHVFELLEDRYKLLASPDLYRAFRTAFASKRRSYAKLLMGASLTSEARAQVWRSLRDCQNANSLAKSSALLFLTYIPDALQPAWPSIDRVVKLKEPAADRKYAASR